MMAESLLSVATVTFSAVAPALGIGRRRAPLFVDEDEANRRLLEDDGDNATSDREQDVDTRIVIGGVVVSCTSCVVLVAAIFGEDGISWWATAIALVLASVFSILGVRALGETDLNPVSAIGKISQLIFAVIQPSNIIANLVVGGVAEAGAQQAGDLMQDLKTGHLLGSSPRAQFQGQVSSQSRLFHIAR